MAYNEVWDNTIPADTQAANQLGLDCRNIKIDVAQRMGTLSGLDAAKPSLENVFAGMLYFATDTGKIYQLSNSGGAATNPGTWTDITSSFIQNVNTAFKILPWAQSAVSATVSSNSTKYLAPSSAAYGFVVVESTAEYVMPVAGTFRSLYIQTSNSQPGDGSLTLTMRKNGVDQTIIVTITAGSAAGVYSDSAHSFSFVAGDIITIKGVNTSPTASSCGVQSATLGY